ncbi:hypothetical protein A5692_14075 [Mycobacterium sp. E342]|uniref:hypothetical protein n=1 Tax=Mycobacterium sp. E342 TaxID=1834147 RepID=UPI000801418B|nr:hypothetical protein [Mycobacterium sp. E342]OBH33535.1 hypothetical protein A5692_14075 [Mycobacterium sp. E342]
MSDGDYEGLKDTYPEQFGSLHIGTPINADTNEVMVDTQPAFYERKLAERGLLSLGSPSHDFVFLAGGTDSKSQDTWGWNTSASMELNAGIADFAAKFYVKQTNDTCKRSSVASIVGMSKATQSVTLEMTPDWNQYYSCMTEGFKNLYDAVIDAACKADKSQTDDDYSTLLDALAKFYKWYGTGFVCKLDLVAYGVVEGYYRRHTIRIEDVFTSGWGVAASLPFVGAEAGGQYVKTHTGEDATTKFKAHAFGRPAQSAQLKWAEDKAIALDGKTLEELVSSDVWSQPPPATVPDPKDPELDYGPIDITQLQAPQLSGSSDILSTAIKALQHMTVVWPGGNANPKDKNDAAKVATEVTSRVAELKKMAQRTEDDINNAALPDPETARAAESLLSVDVDTFTAPHHRRGSLAGAVENQGNDGGEHPSGGNEASGGKATGDLDLGGYTPSGYSYLPWERIFPDLGIGLECTPAQVAFGEALVWYSIRDLFAQYLEFCANFQGVVRDQQGNVVYIKNRTVAFRAALDAVSETLTDKLTEKKFKHNTSFVPDLEKELKTQLVEAGFDMDWYQHYEFWIHNYRWLKEAPFGVVAVIERDGQRYFQTNPYPGNPMHRSTQPNGCAPATSLEAADLITANAYRLYPIISTSAKGEPHFAWVGGPCLLQGDNSDASLRYSGLLTFTQDPTRTPAFRSKRWHWADGENRASDDGNEVLFNEMAVPMLVHQSKDAAEEIAGAEASPWPGLTERWTNRKRVFGMHLYSGVGDDDCFGHQYDFIPGLPPWVVPDHVDNRERSTERLLEIAGKLAHDATAYATVLPLVPPEKDQQKGGQDGQKVVWKLQQPSGVVGAYFAAHDATFFWGPEEGPGWEKQDDNKNNLFTQCPVKFIPINYQHVRNALMAIGEDPDHYDHKTEPAWATAGGGAMWRQPRTDLMKRLKALGEESEKEPAGPV